MKNFLTIVLLIGVIASYVDQRIHIRMLQGEIVSKEMEVFEALSIARDAKMALKANMEASQLNEARLKKLMAGLGLAPEDLNWAVGGE